MSYGSHDPFFGGGKFFDGSTTIGANGLSLALHMPPAWKESQPGRLPPNAPRACFPLHELPTAPKEWKISGENLMSYVVPIPDSHEGEVPGLWIDLRANLQHDKHVAVYPSTQGVNALTRQISDAKDVRLEQFQKTCPEHGTAFIGARHCEKCGWSWPPQNYLASAASSQFWLDGFRTEDGTVRQWYFTPEENRGVAEAVLKKEGRKAVPALGFAFYTSKESKPKPRPVRRMKALGFGPVYGDGLESVDSVADCMLDGAAELLSAPATTASYGAKRRSTRSAKAPQTMHIGGGVEIDQEVGKDPNPVDIYNSEPDLVIVVFYAPASYVEKELLPYRQKSEGGLAQLGVPLGHPSAKTTV